MSQPDLFHVSDDPDIRVFHPRPPPSADSGVRDDVVWAVDERRLPNYLLPRDCPRVTYTAGQKATEADRAALFADTKCERVIAIESGWLERVETAQLFLYRLPTETFELADETAGYYVSRASVTPIDMRVLTDLKAELDARNVELRVLPNLWALRDRVVDSTLDFSVIRFRNAAPRP